MADRGTSEEDSAETLVATLNDASARGATKAEATAYLINMAVDDAGRAAIVEAGGVPALVALVESGNARCKERAASAIAKLAQVPEQKVALAAAAGSLVTLLSEGSAAAKENAAQALYMITASNAETKKTIAASGAVAPLVGLLKDGLPAAKGIMDGTPAIPAADASAAAPPAPAPMKKSLTGKLFGGGKKKEEPKAAAAPSSAEASSAAEAAKERKHAAGAADAAANALQSLALNDDNRSAIAAAGAIAPLIELLQVGGAAGKANAATALLNLSGKSTENKKAIAAAGGLKPLIDLYNDGSPGAQKRAAAALKSLARDDELYDAILKLGVAESVIELTADEIGTSYKIVGGGAEAVAAAEAERKSKPAGLALTEDGGLDLSED